MVARYYITLPDASRARGQDARFTFTAVGAEGFAEQLQAALRTDDLFERWRLVQDDPDEVDPALGATDPGATVEGQQQDLHVNLVVTSAIPGTVLKHRLRLLAGGHWELRDVTAA
ncbi:hypothetical protein [Aerolutibacter ruishenii]|uniref:Uncharacterized protein n=1 Tax=Aerolutibacter ruishenii TaxID=686800 RepID=A0A562LGX3_9GAMM|nr:hypothetical protein [Lysobacter ruishenii]TWI06847.1 hypothetical protein IP93_02839 [Lysobacter ruishenii]